MPDHAALKGIRQSLQEALENDATGKGSISRLSILLSILALIWGLVACLALMAFAQQDTKDLIATFVYALTGGGAGTYTVKRVVEAVASRLGNATPPKE